MDSVVSVDCQPAGTTGDSRRISSSALYSPLSVSKMPQGPDDGVPEMLERAEQLLSQVRCCVLAGNHLYS